MTKVCETLTNFEENMPKTLQNFQKPVFPVKLEER